MNYKLWGDVHNIFKTHRKCMKFGLDITEISL